MNGRHTRIVQDQIVREVSSHGGLRAHERYRCPAVGSLRHDEPADGFEGSLHRAPEHLRHGDTTGLRYRCGHGNFTTRLILAPGRTSREKLFEPSPSRETSIR